jgi:hypothetical protein
VPGRSVLARASSQRTVGVGDPWTTIESERYEPDVEVSPDE